MPMVTQCSKNDHNSSFPEGRCVHKKSYSSAGLKQVPATQ